MAQSFSIDQLLEHLKALVRDSEALLAASAGYVNDGIQETRARAEETVAAAKDRLSGLQQDIAGTAREALDAGEGYLRDNPWQSLAIAAGVGFVLGALLTRRRS